MKKKQKIEILIEKLTERWKIDMTDADAFAYLCGVTTNAELIDQAIAEFNRRMLEAE